MLYSEKMPIFTAKHPAQTVTVDGAAYRYVRSGTGRDKTPVLLNGGMDVATLKTLKKKCFFAPPRAVVHDPLQLRKAEAAPDPIGHEPSPQ